MFGWGKIKQYNNTQSGVNTAKNYVIWHNCIFLLDGYYGNLWGVDNIAPIQEISRKSFLVHFERCKIEKVDISIFLVRVDHDKFVKYNTGSKVEKENVGKYCGVV